MTRILSSLANLCFFIPSSSLLTCPADAVLTNATAHTTNDGPFLAGPLARTLPGPSHSTEQAVAKPWLGYRPLEWSRDGLAISLVQHVVATILCLQVIGVRGHLPTTALPGSYRFTSRKLVVTPRSVCR